MKTASTRAVVNAYLDDNGHEILVRERTEDGGSALRRIRAEYVSWHPATEIDREGMRKLKALPIVHSIQVMGRYVRIAWTDDIARRMGRKGMKENDVQCFEADLDPVQLWLVETKCEIAKPRRAYLDLEADSRVPLSRKEEMRILSWAIVDADTGAELDGVLEEDDDESEGALLRGLSKTLEQYDQIAVWEGDWKGGEFDSIVLPARWRKRGIEVDERRWLWLNQLAVWKKMNMHSAESGAEKESFKLGDIAHEQIGEGKEEIPDFVRERFGEKCDRGLGAITWELWEAGGEFRELLRQYNVRDAVLLRKLEEKKGYITIFQATCEACGIIPITRALNPTAQMDGFMLRLGRERDHRFPTKGWTSDEEEEDLKKYRGAVVFHPKSVPSDVKEGPDKWTDDDARAWRRKHGFKNGILKDVQVCDFTSLYPSVMQTWNLSAEVSVGWAKTLEAAIKAYGENVCVSPGTDLVTRTDVIGFLPLALTELIRLRKVWADLAASLEPGTPEWQNAMAKSTAYKVIANSFYGAGGSKYSRFNDRDVSEACTQNSVHLLKLTAAEAEKRAMVVAYGDTDSNMVIGPTEEGFRKFIAWLNAKRFPAEIASWGCKQNNIKLAFEKTFERLVFVRSKAYVGRYSQYKGKRAKRECHGTEFKHEETCAVCGGHGKLAGEPEIKGVAWKRGDKGKLARELQGRIIDCLVGGVKVRNPSGKKVSINADLGHETPTEDIEVYTGIIERARAHVLDDVLPLAEVRLSQGLKHSLREYAKTETGAHVRVARELVARGQSVGKGTRIEYVVVDGSVSPQRVIPAEDYAGDCDRFFLWERVYTPSKSLLEAAFPDEDWESWGKVRPPKQRAPGKKSKVADDQLGFQLNRTIITTGSEPNRFGSNDDLALTAYRSAPLVIRIPETGGLPAVDRVNEVLRAHPGARTVQIVLVLNSGAEAILKTSLRVSPGPKLKDEVAEAIAGTQPTP